MRKAKWILVLILALSLSSCDLVINLFAGSGTVTGYVYTTSNAGISGVTVSVVGGSASTTTNSSGYYTLTGVTAGTVTLRFAKSGYTFYDVTVTVEANRTASVAESVVGYTVLGSGQWRFVLTWGASPSDLDSHLFVPISGGSSYSEVYFSHKNASDSSANLDYDDTTSYGPETTTISTQNSGTYYYSIYNYSGTGSIKTSGATVKVYKGSTLVQTFSASSASGDSTQRWWRVFTLNGSSLSSVNGFSNSGK